MQKLAINNKLKMLPAFTLAEMLVTLIIFSFILGTFTVVLYTLIRTSYTNDARASLRQSISFSSDIFETYLKNANPRSIINQNPELEEGVLRQELTFGDKSPSPNYYKFVFVEEPIPGTEEKIGRMYIYDCFSKPSCPEGSSEKRILTYRDTSIDLQESFFEFYTVKADNKQPFVVVNMYLEADSTYIANDGEPAAQDYRRLVSIEAK